VIRNDILQYRTGLGPSLLAVERDSWRPPRPLDGLTVVLVTTISPNELIREAMTINERAFDPHAPEVDAVTAEAFRPSLNGCAAVTARWAGQCVAGGMFTRIRGGVTELTGIGTLQTHRRRGFAGAVTARLTQAAFDAGARIVFVTTDNHAARRVYRRVGFLDL
jgi:predicted GNAT family acetyltransferase